MTLTDVGPTVDPKPDESELILSFLIDRSENVHMVECTTSKMQEVQFQVLIIVLKISLYDLILMFRLKSYGELF